VNFTELFRSLIQKTTGVAGAEVFRRLCVEAKEALPFFEICWIGKKDPLYERVTVLEFEKKDRIGSFPNSYMLSGQACEEVYKLPEPQVFDLRYSNVSVPVDIPNGFYYGIPIIDMKGQVLGHFGVILSKKIDLGETEEWRIFLKKLRLEIERMEDDMRESETKNKLQAVLDSTMDGIVAFDEDYRILIFNDAAEQILKSEPGKNIGHSFKRFLTPDFRSACDEYMVQCMQQKNNFQSLYFLNKHLKLRDGRGGVVEAEVNFSCIRYKNEMYFTVIIRDLAMQNQMQYQINQLKDEKTKLITEIKSFYNRDIAVGKSPAFEKVLDDIRKVSQTSSTVLLTGETGTGKELIAATIHNTSKRQQNIFIKVNCTALPSSLIESELFGHEKGAFTGATSMRKGRFELADGGTLFLDEIGELNKDVQSKLLRVLQEREFERVGGSETIHVNVRIIAATHQNLLAKVRDGSFREDLFFRLNVFPIHVPPLRERISDLPLLAKYLIDKLSLNVGKNVRFICNDALALLREYSWPGNIRELSNVLERAIILCDEETIRPSHIFLTQQQSKTENEMQLVDMEIRHIKTILIKTRGKIAGRGGAAELLGINRSTLISKMKKLNIDHRQLSS